MPINIARQIIADNVPVIGAPINRHTRRARIIRQWCIFRTGRDEYRAHRY